MYDDDQLPQHFIELHSHILPTPSTPNTKKPGLATTNRSNETGARDTKHSDNECTNGKPNEKKRSNPSGEGESGILKSAWGEDGETTLQGARSARRRAGEQRVCGPVPKGYTATAVHKGQRSEQKTRKTQ
jgi:hypothetical protein